MTAEQDLYPIWHPYTQMQTEAAPLKVVRARGVKIELADGRELIDCISSWWVNVHGHCRPEIARAIYEQALNLEHVIFAGFTHEPAENLARRLLELLGGDFTRVFYSDNGSTAVEVALKMALQYWHNLGRLSRMAFIGFEGGYHGDTVGAMSLGGSSPFWGSYRSVLFDVDTVPYPWTFEGDERVEQKEEYALSCLREKLEQQAEKFAGLIIEPLVQGAGGMRMVRPRFLQSVQDLCRQYGVLLIYDEVMTGFGRTGDWFALAKSDTAPDIICLSKGIAGGFLPLAVTACNERIYKGFLSEDPAHTLFHGHSFTANPISCAAAVASLQLLAENEDSFRQMEERHRRWFNHWLINAAGLENVRFCGTIAAFDVVSDAATNYFNSLGKVLRRRFLASGLLIRPLGNTIYLMPPYCITDEELSQVYKGIKEVLAETIGAQSLKARVPLLISAPDA
ncbi:MAG TPA: adenosylmethionine--8-amino-7-oxononanoate transaminase [Candidatus Obscuribacterales bacterium]